MTVELNHTIIPATDKWRSAKFLADILGLEAGPEWSHLIMQAALRAREEAKRKSLPQLRTLVPPSEESVANLS